MPRGVASAGMSRGEAEVILAELARRGDGLRKLDFGALSFGAQRTFIEDDSPFVLGRCSRRAGKTDGAVLKALRGAHKYPGSMIPYIALSRPHAKTIAWPKMMLWDRRLGLGAKFNHAELTMFIPSTGSTIVLGGANDETDIERYRGGAYPLVILDEAQAFRPFIERLIVDILLPATVDYDNSQIVLIGTPNASCSGYFHDASLGIIKHAETGDPMFSEHHWTAWDNPFLDQGYREGKHNDPVLALARARRALASKAAAAGLTDTDPRYLREFLGQWVQDESGLVYRVRPYSIIEDLPSDVDDWVYVLGMDVGFVDATAFVVMAFSPTARVCVVVESYQETEMLPSHQMAEVRRIEERYDLSSVVIDPGGGGKGLVEELVQRHGVPAKVAAKREKLAAIQTLNGDLQARTCLILRSGNENLLHDLGQLQWNFGKLRRRGGAQWELKPANHLSIDDRTPDHLADAFLYAHRECLHYLSEDVREPARAGSPEWLKEQEDAMFEAIARQAAGPEGPWWEAPPRP